MYEIILLCVSIFGGFLGAILGVGGGMIIVPVLTLLMHVDIRYAIAASLISIVATSSGAAAGYLKDRLTNLRLAVLLEVGTVLGAISGFLLASYIRPRELYLLFGSILVITMIMNFRKRKASQPVENHPWAEKLHLHGAYPERDGQWVSYAVARVPLGIFFMFGAGVLSALLGIGSGVFKVTAMDGLMKLPIKVSSATSNFMIGVTAAASAGAYLTRGSIRPEIACPMAIGIIVGSYFGSRVMPKLPAALIRKIFFLLLLVVALEMFRKGFSS